MCCSRSPDKENLKLSAKHSVYFDNYVLLTYLYALVCSCSFHFYTSSSTPFLASTSKILIIIIFIIICQMKQGEKGKRTCQRYRSMNCHPLQIVILPSRLHRLKLMLPTMNQQTRNISHTLVPRRYNMVKHQILSKFPPVLQGPLQI